MLDQIDLKICKSFLEAGYSVTSPAFERSQRRGWETYQITTAMDLARQHRIKPLPIARSVAGKIETIDAIDRVKVEGVGYINFTLKSEAVVTHLRQYAADDQPQPKAKSTGGGSLFLDYGGPNIAKAMHVGHLRSALIGDTLRRLARYLGIGAVADIHLGDWGGPIGVVIAGLQAGAESSAEGAREPPSLYSDMTYLSGIYAQSVQQGEVDPSHQDYARAIAASLQRGETEFRPIWCKLRAASIASIRRNYDALNVHFDFWYGESDAADTLERLLGELKRDAIAVESEGAIVIPLAGCSSEDTPPLILQTKRGGVLYGGTDLATLDLRLRSGRYTHILYVVDRRQSLHFEQVFAAAKKAGILNQKPPILEHIDFGTINGPDGKPLKTRAGDAFYLEDLIKETEHAIRCRTPVRQDRSTLELGAIVHKLAVASIRFADLSHNRTSNYVFDVEKFVSHEGKTGAYLCYAAVRAAAVLKQCRDVRYPSASLVFRSDEEQSLAVRLLEFDRAVRRSFDRRLPHLFCQHLFELARDFNTVYHAHRIVTEADPGRKALLTMLTDLTARQLRMGLGLLGIEVPEWM